MIWQRTDENLKINGINIKTRNNKMNHKDSNCTQRCYNSIYWLTLIHKWRWLRLISSYIWSCLSEIVVLFDQPPKKKETACLNLTSYMSGFDDKQYNWKKNFHKIKKKKKHFCNFFIFWKKIFLCFCIFQFFVFFFF